MRKFWKHMSLALAMLMVIGLAACGDTETTTTTGTSSATAGTADSSTSKTEAGVSTEFMAPYAAYPETVSLTFARIMNRGAQLAEGEDTQKNCQINFIKQKLNIDCLINWETSPDQYNHRLALAIAGGALPDVFMIQSDNYLSFVDLVKNGALADLSAAYDSCTGDLAKEWLGTYGGKQLDSATFEGKLMGIPQPVGGYNYNILWVRSDWLKKVNMPAPKTADDIRNVAKAFIDAKLGGDQTIGIVVDPVKPLDKSDRFLSLSSVANSQGAYPQSWITGADGKALWGSIAPEMKKTLEILADWYKTGILDPQWMTYQNVDAVTPNLREGRCGMYFGAWWSPWTMADSVKTNAEMDWIPVLAPLDSNGKFNHINPIDSTKFIVVNAACKNPEAAVKANNLEFELINGVYDKDQAVVDACAPSKKAGSFGRTLSPFSGFWLADIFDRNIQIGVAQYNYCKTGTLNMPSFATAADLDNAELALKYFRGEIKPSDEAFSQAYSLYNCAVDSPLVLDPGINYDKPVAYSFTTASMADYMPALTSLEREAVVKIISGEKPLDYFDEFVAQWKASGGDKITAEVQEVIDSKK